MAGRVSLETVLPPFLGKKIELREVALILY
jgi:hypothetical protein